MSQENNHIDEALLMLFITGEAKLEQIEKVQNWLALSDENQTLLDQLHEIWIQSDALQPTPIDVNIDNAWEKVSTKIDQIPESETKAKKIGLPQQVLRIAAVLILIVAGIWIVNIFRNIQSPLSLISQQSILTDTLGDGSIVSLNKNSELVYASDFDKEFRKVKLNGEAFFDIEPNPEKAFIIDAGNSFIKVLGTSFNVEAFRDSTEVKVSVIEGLVQFYHLDAKLDTVSILLSVNESGTYNRKTQILSKNEDAHLNELYWLSKTLVFEKTRLSEVFSLMEQIFNIEIEVSAEPINEFLLSATFEDDNAEAIFMIIAATFNLNIEKENNQYLIGPNSTQNE